MSPEQLKLIVDLLNGTREDAVRVVLLIVAKDAMMEFVQYGLVAVGLCLAYRSIRQVIAAASGLNQIAANIDTITPFSAKAWDEAIRLMRVGRAAERKDTK